MKGGEKLNFREKVEPKASIHPYSVKMRRAAPYIWGGLILTLSSIPNLTSPYSKTGGIDKLAHFGEYLIFALLIFNKKQKGYIMPLILLFAVVDELHQKFIPGREVEISDLGLNFAGILCGWLILEEKMKIFKNKKGQNELSQMYDKINKLDKRIGKLEWNMRNSRIRRTKREDLRVGVFVDVQNMFYAAKKQFEARLDYVKLLSHILKGRRLIKAVAYVIENPEIDQSGFLSLLGHHSFEIRKKPLIQRSDGSQKGDFDMEMALDILSLVDQLDVVVLVSGDGDFSSLVETIKVKGPRVEVYGFPQNTAIDLKEATDEFFPIGNELLFKQ